MISPYAFSKRSCELLNYVYHNLYEIDIINLRFFTVYGPKQRPDLAIHKFVKLIDEGKPITLYGDGSTSRDYTHIDDIIDGILNAINYLFNNVGVYEIINLGNHSPISLNEMVRIIYDCMENRSIQIDYKPIQPGDVDITFADISYANKLLGYNPKIKFTQGIKEFITWYYEQK